MAYRFLDDITSADMAFEASGKTVEELLASSGMALFNVQVNLKEKQHKAFGRNFKFSLEAENIESLLFKFLSELIFIKDSEMLLLGEFKLDVKKERGLFKLDVDANGDEISSFGDSLIEDVKAVSMHRFSVKKKDDLFAATVVLDV